MNFFSSEIAQTAQGEFVLIDYVNDQCHMLSQSAHPGMGVPDGVVAVTVGVVPDGVVAVAVGVVVGLPPDSASL